MKKAVVKTLKPLNRRRRLAKGIALMPKWIKNKFKPKPVVARDIRKSVLDNLKKFEKEHVKPHPLRKGGSTKVELPMNKIVNNVALGLIEAYGKEAKLKETHIRRLLRIARIEMNIQIGTAERDRILKVHIGRRKLRTEVEHMETNAMHQAKNGRMVNDYLREIGQPTRKKMTQEQLEIEAEIIKRANYKAAITLSDIATHLNLHNYYQKKGKKPWGKNPSKKKEPAKKK